MKPRTPEQVLEYLRKLQEKLTPDLRKKVGDVLFGSDDRITKLQGVRIPRDGSEAEPNTDWEDKLFIDIQYWTDYPGNQVAKYFKQNKELLGRLAKEFPKVLQPPIGDVVYRGTSIKKDSLESAFKNKKFQVVRVAGREVFYFKNLKYSPSRPAQSWTLSPKIAFGFRGKYGDEDDTHIPVVYSTKVNKDFIFNPILLRIIFGADEKETVRLADIGTFEAFVDANIIYNNWDLEPKDFFIHKLPSAKPYFNDMVAKYNKLVAVENKKYGDMLSSATSVQDILYYDEDGEPTPDGFDVRKEYAKCSKKYIESIKNK